MSSRRTPPCSCAEARTARTRPPAAPPCLDPLLRQARARTLALIMAAWASTSDTCLTVSLEMSSPFGGHEPQYDTGTGASRRRRRRRRCSARRAARRRGRSRSPPTPTGARAERSHANVPHAAGVRGQLRRRLESESREGLFSLEGLCLSSSSEARARPSRSGRRRRQAGNLHAHHLLVFRVRRRVVVRGRPGGSVPLVGRALVVRRAPPAGDARGARAGEGARPRRARARWRGRAWPRRPDGRRRDAARGFAA